jgi:hypothetical protein
MTKPVRKPTVAVDLDGVLAQYDGKWRGVEQIGDPIPGAVEFTKELSKVADILVWTTRTNQEVNFEFGLPELRELVAKWLDLHGFSYRAVYVGDGKPIACAYIDDRAINCQPQKYWSHIAYSEALLQVQDFLPDQATAGAIEQAPPSQNRSS